MITKPFSTNGPLNVAVLGASGAVGQELIQLLQDRSFPIKELRLLASARSAGVTQHWNGHNLEIQEVNDNSFEDINLVLASAGSSVSRYWRKTIEKAGALMIDNSSAFRMESGVPLVVPEVNPKAAFLHNGVIANPNCTTILLTLAIAPLATHQEIKRVIVSTYQSASGAGARAMEELKQHSKEVLEGKTPQSEVLPYSLAFNLFLHNSPLGANNYCEEEMMVSKESKGKVKTVFDRDINNHLYSGKTWDYICKRIINALPDRVYISIDIDGLSPDLCSHTGTPVPGGLSYNHVIYLLEKLAKSNKKIIGCDLVEVGDHPWDANVGARLLYQLCGWFWYSAKIS